MRRVLIIATLVVLGGAPAPAGASARSVPPGFFGAMANGPLELPGVDLDAEFGVMRRAGVESARVPMRWPAIEARRGLADFTATDRTVAAAARRGVGVLGLVYGSPAWAATDPRNPFAPPRADADYAAFLRALVGRYGPRGSFWAANPGLPRRPVRAWQLWNEPSLPRYFAVRDWAPRYARLARAGYRAVKGADRGATVVAAGLPNFSWRDLRSLYRAGARGGRHFDVVAIHPFTGTAAGSVEILRRVRRVMNRHGGRRTPIWVTEVSWPSGRGKAKSNQRWVTTPRGMAVKVREVYTAYARARRSLRLQRAYWYAWATTDRDSPNAFDYAGLRTYTPAGRFADKPAVRAYREIARRLTR